MEAAGREGRDQNVKITAQMLKSKTGQFDLESIMLLKLKNVGICNLGCIGDCVNLERLDLSGNNISNLTPLASLKLLTVLNLSANRISKLDPLHSCENLQNLNLSGNLISSVDVLRPLSELKNLETIRLKDTVCNFTNPVCMNTSYRRAMLEIFPKIKVLDGERMSGSGRDLYQVCKDMDSSLKVPSFKSNFKQQERTKTKKKKEEKNKRGKKRERDSTFHKPMCTVLPPPNPYGKTFLQSDTAPMVAFSSSDMCSRGPVGERPGPMKWVEDSYWKLKPTSKTQSDKAVEQFYNILKECRELNNKAADIIANTERNISNVK